MSALLQAMQNSRVNHQIEGEWFAMRWQPDIATEETLNVGVVFRERESGRLKIKTLDYWDRLDCLFGDFARDQLQFLLDVECSQIKYGLQVPSSPNMRFSEPRLARGESAEEIVERLYDRVVTLGRRRKARKEERFKGFSTAQLQQYVYDELHTRTPFLYEYLTTNTTVIPPEGEDHKMDVSFLAPGLIGNVVSTIYKEPKTASFYLLEATTRLEAAARSRTNIKYDDEDVKLFVLTPSLHSPGMSKSEVSSIREQIDTHIFRVKKTGIDIVAEDTKAALANEVIAWGERHRA